MSYRILQGHTIDLLEEFVREHIAMGWKPLGSPFQFEVSIYQAMVKG